MKPDYKNWIPKGMLFSLIAGGEGQAAAFAGNAAGAESGNSQSPLTNQIYAVIIYQQYILPVYREA